MAKYLNQIAYTTEEGEAATWQVLADRPLSLRELVYLFLYDEDDGLPISEADVQSWIDDHRPFGPDNLELAQLAQRPAEYADVAIPDWLNEEARQRKMRYRVYLHVPSWHYTTVDVTAESPDRAKELVLADVTDGLEHPDWHSGSIDLDRVEAYYVEREP